MKVDLSKKLNILPGRKIRQLKTRIIGLGTRLISPSVVIPKPDGLRQSRLLAAMLITLIILGLFAEGLTVLFSPEEGPVVHWLSILSVVSLGFAFHFNRTGRLLPAAWLSIAVLSIAIYGMTFLTYGQPVKLDFLVYLILPLLFASVFLSDRMLGLLAGIFIAAILAAGLIPGMSAAELIVGPASFIGMTGGIIFLIFHHRNILELDRRGELIEKEERYRTLLETSYEGICILANGKILDANPNFARMLGCQLSDLIAQPVTERLPLVMQNESLAGYTQGEGRLATFPILRRDGSSFYVEAVSKMQPYRGEPARVIAIRDITEQVKAQDAQDRNERLYRSLFEGANDAIFLISFSDTYIAVNQKAADMLGYSVDELIGSSVSGVVVDREYADVLDKKKNLLSGKSIATYQRIFRKKNGDEFPAEINISMVRDREEKPLYIQSIVRDITNRKRSEARIQLQLERLNALREIDKMITGSLDLKATLATTLKQAETQLDIPAAAVLLADPQQENLEVFSAAGIDFEDMQVDRVSCAIRWRVWLPQRRSGCLSRICTPRRPATPYSKSWQDKVSTQPTPFHSSPKAQ